MTSNVSNLLARCFFEGNLLARLNSVDTLLINFLPLLICFPTILLVFFASCDSSWLRLFPVLELFLSMQILWKRSHMVSYWCSLSSVTAADWDYPDLELFLSRKYCKILLICFSHWCLSSAGTAGWDYAQIWSCSNRKILLMLSHWCCLLQEQMVKTLTRFGAILVKANMLFSKYLD